MRSGLASSVGVQAGGLGDHFQGCGWMCQSDGHKTCPFEDTGGSTRRPVSPSPLPATQCISQRRGSWPLQVAKLSGLTFVLLASGPETQAISPLLKEVEAQWFKKTSLLVIVVQLQM